MKFLLSLAVLGFAITTLGCKSVDVDDSAKLQVLQNNAASLSAPEQLIRRFRVDTEANLQHEIADAKVREQLKKKVSLSQDKIEIQDVIAFVRQKTGIQISVNWNILANSKIDRSAPVSIQLADVPASQPLDLALQQVSAEAFDDDKADYMVQDGVVVISTRRDLQSRTVTRTYDINWFLNQQRTLQHLLYHKQDQAREIRALLLQNEFIALDTASTQAPEIENEATIFASPQDTRFFENRTSSGQLIDEVRELMQQNIGEPDEWLDEQSTIDVINGFLHVRTTTANHAEILSLLAQLYVAQVEQYEKQAALIEVFILLQRAEEYRLKQDYPAALHLVNQALNVDPDSPYARSLKKILVGAMTN